MHQNEVRPVNCDGGRSSMKVQNQVRVWPVSQRTSSSHDGKMANLPFLEIDEEGEHTDGLTRRPRYIRAWLIDIIITCLMFFNTTIGLPFSALLSNKCVLY